MKYYFLLQYRRIIRGIKNFGLNPYAGIGVSLLSFFLFSMFMFKKISAAPYLYVCVAIFFIYSRESEIRNQFLKTIFPKNKLLLVRMVENVLIALPFLIFLVVKKQRLPAFVLFGFSILFSFYNNPGLRLHYTIPSPFSKKPYEFTTGFRSMYWLLILLYTVTGYALVYHNPNLGIVCLMGVFLLCSSFYSHLDPIFYVWIHAQPARLFLRQKIKTALLYGSWLGLPILIVLVFFYPAQAILMIIFFMVGLLYISVTVLSVYINFPVRMTITQNLQLYMGILFPPALLIIIPIFYFQAVRRLKEYFPC
jgi:hypothetical protein